MGDEEKAEEAAKKGTMGKKGEVDFLCEAAMDNVYYVCHNVQELLASRGYCPPGYEKKKAVCLHVANPTTPAQYAHLLRRQVIRNYRKPLVIVAPKILLRLPEAVSPLSDLAPGTHFKTVIGDTIANPLKVKRVILVSGKHYYELNKERIKANIEDVAILRVESLAPFPLQGLQIELDKYPNARKFIWSQEEHRNMGAWSFIKPRFENLLGKKVTYAGRAEYATPAVGTSTLHRKEVEHILKEPLYNLK